MGGKEGGEGGEEKGVDGCQLTYSFCCALGL